MTLLFGKVRCSSSQLSSPNFSNQASHEKLIYNLGFNLLDRKNRQVILAKADGNPSTPITPPANRRPSNYSTPPTSEQPSQNMLSADPYRVPPKFVD